MRDLAARAFDYGLCGASFSMHRGWIADNIHRSYHRGLGLGAQWRRGIMIEKTAH
jgi:hypothetical protein